MSKLLLGCQSKYILKANNKRFIKIIKFHIFNLDLADIFLNELSLIKIVLKCKYVFIFKILGEFHFDYNEI